jgi:hypothetical protein
MSTPLTYEEWREMEDIALRRRRTCKHPKRHRLFIHRWCDVLGAPHCWTQWWCALCDEWLPLGPSNDRVPRDELALAEHIGDVCMLWEPRDQDALINRYVEGFASQVMLP